MEARRCRDPGEGKSEIHSFTRSEPGATISGTKIRAVGSATWLEQGRPWAFFTLEEIVYNADVSEMMRRRGC